MQSIIIREERTIEYRRTEELIRNAFWDKYAPGCSEHLLFHKLRNSSIFVSELSRVAEVDGQLVGMICYVKGCVQTQTETLEILSFGPLAVAPEHQGQGIGSCLVNTTVQLAKQTCYPAIVIYGDFNYYKRFGFEKAEKYGLSGPDGLGDALLVLMLDKNKQRLEGCLIDEPIYHLSPEEVGVFDSLFPKREKHKLPTQIFDEVLN